MKKLHVLLLILGLVITKSALALGPVDGEAILFWWANDTRLDVVDREFDSGSFGGHGELWWNNAWGIKGALYRTDLEEAGFETNETLSVDIKRRLLSITDNSFLAVGLGWEDIEIEDGNNSAGIRLTLEGRVGLIGVSYLYGQGAWFPSLDDVSQRSDMEGNEYEAGISFDPLPFLSLRAGYRQFKLDFLSDINGISRSTRSGGIVLGAGIHW